MTMELKEIQEQIAIRLVTFTENYTKSDNKAALKRARKASVELTKLFKDFRKASVWTSPHFNI